MTTVMKDFTQSAPRPLPVILLADVSGSMAGEGKIQALNQAVRDMLSTFSKESVVGTEIQTAVITFGSAVELHTSLQPASKIQWVDMQANGCTPMGAAVEKAIELVEDKNTIPSRAYRPTIILISDGQPTDDWKTAFQKATREGRASKAHRMALAIGADADENILAQFISATEDNRVFHAQDASQIKNFFKFVTMSVVSRSRSNNPNQILKVPEPPIDISDKF